MSKLTQIHKGSCASWWCQHLAASYSPSRSPRATGEPLNKRKKKWAVWRNYLDNWKVLKLDFILRLCPQGFSNQSLFYSWLIYCRWTTQKISLAYNFKIQLLLDLSTWKRIKILERAFFVHGNAVWRYLGVCATWLCKQQVWMSQAPWLLVNCQRGVQKLWTWIVTCE